MEEQRNEFLWKLAKKRVGFKSHLITYVVVIVGFWVVYLLMLQQPWGSNIHPWPIWPTLGWGIGLASHYFGAFGSFNQESMAKKEYEKLLKNK
jgi:hypothetical protein